MIVNVYHLLGNFTDDIQTTNKRYEPPEFDQRQLPNKPVVCDYCKRRGHTKSECYSLKLNKSLPKLTGFILSENRYILKMNAMITLLKDDKHEKLLSIGNKISISGNILDAQKECEIKRPDDLTMKAFKPFMFDGSVALLNKGRTIQLLMVGG